MELVVLNKNTIAFSEKEVKIVELLSKGERAKQVAKKMKLSVRTIEFNISALINKANVKTQAHLVALFLRNNIIK